MHADMWPQLVCLKQHEALLVYMPMSSGHDNIARHSR